MTKFCPAILNQCRTDCVCFVRHIEGTTLNNSSDKEVPYLVVLTEDYDYCKNYKTGLTKQVSEPI